MTRSEAQPYPKRPKKYPREYKEAAVLICVHSPKSVAQIARELGIPEGELHRWYRDSKKQLEMAKEEPSRPLEEDRRSHVDVDQLKRDVDQLKWERDALRDVLAHGSQS